MENAYLHIVTNHLPIIGVPLAVAFLVLGIWRKSDDLKSAAFLTFVILGFGTLATFLLGQAGEDFVEKMAGVSEKAISDHEDLAKIALALVAVTALFSLFAAFRYQGLAFFRRKITSSARLIEGELSASQAFAFPKWITFAVLLLALLSGGVLGYTGKLGGMIRHTEFYGGAQNNKDPESEDKKTSDTDTEQKESDTESGKGRKRNRGER